MLHGTDQPLDLMLEIPKIDPVQFYTGRGELLLEMRNNAQNLHTMQLHNTPLALFKSNSYM